MRAARLRASLLALALIPAPAIAQPVQILFVGNSFTHGRYDPVRSFDAGFGRNQVHDLLCSSARSCVPAEASRQVDPAAEPPPGATLAAKLGYLSAHPGARYTEPGPRGGTPGIFLRFTEEAGLRYEVSEIAVSAASLAGYLKGEGHEAGILPQIASPKWDRVVLQDQSFEPLSPRIAVAGRNVPTKGNPRRFHDGVAGLIAAIDAADRQAGRSNAAITLFETPPLASYGYTSRNPDAPIYGMNTSLAGTARAPYVGARDPMAAMAHDLHQAYVNEASANHVGVALAGDAWITAMDRGVAVRDPYGAPRLAGSIDLWDSNPLQACCTVPIGYHPSPYGAYLDALVLFATITGVDPETLSAEFDPAAPSYERSVSKALGIAPAAAHALATAAWDTVAATRPSAGASRPSTPGRD